MEILEMIKQFLLSEAIKDTGITWDMLIIFILVIILIYKEAN